jgi:hypothetical protein
MATRSLVDVIQVPARQHAALAVTEHRPWPLADA